ncbi:MAG: DUF4442 domain-containing protein, partial [Pseudomonadota bacterium]
GAAYAGAFVDRMMSVRPVAASAEISYLKIAKGKLTATGKLRGDAEALKATLDAEEKVRFPVDVSIKDEGGSEVATMSVEWHVKNLS